MLFNTRCFSFAKRQKTRSEKRKETWCTRGEQVSPLLMRGLCINNVVKEKILSPVLLYRASLQTFQPAGDVSQPLSRPSSGYDRLPSPSHNLSLTLRFIVTIERVWIIIMCCVNSYCVVEQGFVELAPCNYGKTIF